MSRINEKVHKQELLNWNLKFKFWKIELKCICKVFAMNEVRDQIEQRLIKNSDRKNIAAIIFPSEISDHK